MVSYLSLIAPCLCLWIFPNAGLFALQTTFSMQRGWHTVGNGYQYALTSRKLTFRRASLECEGWGGSLAQHGIRDRFYFNKIAAHFSTSAWVGLDDRSKERRFQWADKRPVNLGWMQAWHFLQPDNRINEDCVIMTNEPCNYSPRLLDDVFCGLQYFGICELSIGDPPQYHFMDFDGFMYTLITAETMYSLAQNECEAWGGYLAERPVTDVELAELLIENLYLDDDLKNLDTWIGLNDVDDEGDLVYESGNDLNVTEINWIFQANTGVEDCGTFNPNNSGTIRLERCDVMRTILCEKPATSLEQEISQPCLPDAGECDLNGYRSIDGACRNLLNPDRGREGRPFKRLLPAVYEDGFNTPRGGVPSNLPSPRAVIQGLNDSTEPISTLISHQFPLWGQFIAHDLTKLGELKDENGAILLPCPCGDTNPECFNIPIPDDDPVRVQKECYDFVRAKKVPDINCKLDVRQQENKVTAYIDASNVYGSNSQFFNNLRDDNGMLKIGSYNPPCPYHTLPIGPQVDGSMHSQFECEPIHFDHTTLPCFVAGDIRVNEQAPLSSGHTMWLRKHNQLAEELTVLNPHWDSERVFQTARHIISALNQQITYNEFLPVLLGETNMQRYGLKLTTQGFWYGYDASCDPTIAAAFATAALRMGHTLINGILSRPHPDYSTDVDSPDIDLRTQFFDPSPILEKYGTGAVVRGMVSDHAMKYDTQFAGALVNHLFAKPGEFGKDLPSINLQRGRDFALPSYMAYRHFCGLSTATNFKDMEDIPESNQMKLKQIYESTDDIDLFAGGISEVPRDEHSGIPGPLFTCILSHQFKDLRKGDPYWFENGGPEAKFTYSQLQSIKQVSLSRVICDVIENVTTIQPVAMLQHTVDGNTRVDCESLSELDLKPFEELEGGGFVETMSDEGNAEEDNEWTMWFPLSIYSGKEIPLHPASAMFRYLRVYRPDDVCVDVIGNELRKVNGFYQIRFKCRPGTIMGTDFPPVDAEEVYWTKWSNQDESETPFFDDNESISGSGACFHPVAIQAQTVESVPARETGDVFEVFSPIHGLHCKGIHQASGQCHDYRVRFLCLKG